MRTAYGSCLCRLDTAQRHCQSFIAFVFSLYDVKVIVRKVFRATIVLDNAVVFQLSIYDKGGKGTSKGNKASCRQMVPVSQLK